MVQRVAGVLLALAAATAPIAAFQQPAAPEGFVQVNEVPTSERLPAAPFLIAAYAFFLVLMIGYIWSVARRLDKVQRELSDLQRSQRGSSS
jgi:hypothetical protein